MRRSPLVATPALLVLAMLPASAQTAPTVNKTWVSSTGTDTGSCQLAAPCKTFAYAISETNAGGEIDVKDAGSYGAFTITKSVAILADGALATVGVQEDGTGITIAAANSDKVLLRGLTIDGHNIGQTGIRVGNALNVTIDHCVVRDVTYGILASSGFVLITNNVISGGYEAVSQVNSANTYIGGNVITGANFGLAGRFNTYGDNKINGSTECDTCQATLQAAGSL